MKSPTLDPRKSWSPPSWLRKPAWNAFIAWHAFRGLNIPYRPLAQVLAIQHRRVRQAVHYAYRHVPHYTEAMNQLGLQPRDFRTAEDLARLPLVTKDQLLDSPDRFVAAHYKNERGIRLHSSGTSGRAREIIYDPRAAFLALANSLRQRRAMSSLIGSSSGYREIDFTREGGIGTQLRAFYEANSWIPAQADLKRRNISPAEPFEQMLEQINEFQPTVIRGYGSLLGSLFQWVHSRGLPLNPPRLIHYGGDQMPEATRQLIENVLGIPVISTYQACEALLIAFQCEARKGFHISLDQVALRVIDPSGNSVKPGETGEVVLSNLTNRATVLLNFKIGDLATLSADPCNCGRSLPMLERIDGRADHLIAMPGGSMMHSLPVMASLQLPGVVQVQLIQNQLKQFRLNVVAGDAVDWAVTCRGLESAMQDLFGRDLELTIEKVARIAPEPGGKVRAAISRCTS